MKKVGRIIWRCVVVLVLLSMALLIARVLMQADTSVLKRVSANDILRGAYAEDGFTAMTHDVPYQISAAVTGTGTVTSPEDRVKSGYFAAYGFVWFPTAHQVQVVVRYNKYVYDDLGVPDGHEFTFSLRNGKTGEQIRPTYTESDSRWMYEYRRLVFDNVTLDGEADLWIDLSTAPDAEAVNTLVCHYAEQYGSSMKLYSLSRAEKKALAAQ